MSVVAAEIAAVLPEVAAGAVTALARSLVATAYGHGNFALHRTFNMLGETAPVEAVLARVRQAIEAANLRPNLPP